MTVCSVIDHRWHQNVLKTKKWCTSLRRVCHWCFNNILLWFITEQAHSNMESIRFVPWTERKNKDKLNLPLIALLFEDLFQWDQTFSKSQTLLFVSTSSLSFFQGLHLVSEPALVKEEPDVLFWPDCTGEPIWETCIYSQWDTWAMTVFQSWSLLLATSK